MVDARPVIGVFGGTFDPPHLAHTLLPSYLRARGDVDRIIVVPCADHPLGKTMSPFWQRLGWTRAAMAIHGPVVEVSDVEARLADVHGGPSYSLRMLRTIAAAHPHARIRMVIGSDIVVRGEHLRWHRWGDIEREFDPIIVPRAGFAPPETCALPHVSSSQVRLWLEAGNTEAVVGAVPASVLPLLAARVDGPVWIIGRGHVQSHLQPWLERHGYQVQAHGARALLDGREALPEGTPACLLLLVRDCEIGNVSSCLCSRLDLSQEVPVLHAAGRLKAEDVLSPWRVQGHPVGTLHPICSLRRGVGALEGAAFGYEGDSGARAWVESWCPPSHRLDLQDLDATQRVAYHAACALVANHLPVLLDPACKTLEDHGLPTAAAWRALIALLRSAVENLASLGLPAGVTGPLSRGEIDIVRDHMAVLEPDTAALYATLSQRLAQILGRADARGLEG